MKHYIFRIILIIAYFSIAVPFYGQANDNSEPVAVENVVTAEESELPDTKKELADNSGRSSRSNFFVIGITCLIALEAMIFIARHRKG